MARILLVDDDITTRLLLRRLLEKAGHEVTEARDGSEALQQFRDTAPDLVATDVIMPGTDGIAAIEQLRREKPDVRIIAFTAGAHDFPVSRVPGANLTFAKPLKPDEFLGAVDSLLNAG